MSNIYGKPLEARDIVKHAKHGEEFIDPYNIGYMTEGGAFIVASAPQWNDDGEPHDLVGITAFGLVVALRPTVNPEFVSKLEEAIKEAQSEQA